MRSRALCTTLVHVSSWNGLGLSTRHFWRVDTTCSLSINKHTSYWENSLWIQRMAATAPQNSEPRHCPLGLHALWGLLAAGVVGGRPRGGWPATVLRGALCQALSLPGPPVVWSGQPGFRNPCVPGAVGAGVGTLHRPHSVRPCGPALLPVGVAEGRPRGGCLPPL